MRRRLVLASITALAGIILTAVIAGWWGWARLQSSLPQLDGHRREPGLSSAVTIERDSLGIPTIRGASRIDVAQATGFVHAQDRFFQMDLARRRAAGELAGLVGSRALPLDRDVRIHRFRAEARRALSLLSSSDRAALDAYTRGVNEGLAALSQPPFEYMLLGQQPAAWRQEDSLLVLLSMFLTLQDADGSYESTLATLHEVLPRAMADFLAPAGTVWDAPMLGPSLAVPPIPGPDIYNPRVERGLKGGIDLPALRRVRGGGQAAPVMRSVSNTPEGTPSSPWDADRFDSGGLSLGSNSFAVAGRLTPNGGALVANDMHLTIRVPNTWYRASLSWRAPSWPGGQHSVTGVTLPGLPAVVVGSNTQVAWGFTNAYADFSDIVLLEIDPQDPTRYRTPDGWKTFEHHEEVIPVAGREPERDDVVWTMWGPVLPPDSQGRPRALRWVAHSADRLASSLLPLESSRTLDEAFESANTVGAPGQNVLIADRNGRIGWSIYGAIPRRKGLDGREPTSWADGRRGWDGWLAPREYPRISDPADGRLWTANARVVDGTMLAVLGDGSYDVGARAHAIRERLMGQKQFGPRDLLNIQLDARAGFLERWRGLLLRTLTPSAIEHDAGRSEMRTIVERGWHDQAASDSVAYALVRAFRDEVSARVVSFALADCYDADPTFDYARIRRQEGPIWQIVTQRPLHLLDPTYRNWDDLLIDAVDAVIDPINRLDTTPLAERVWSRYNETRYRHPLSASVPILGRWLDMPAVDLPGDTFTPNMHFGAHGPSERMVVAPGHERDGIMHMPTGQSGHPLSPFYSNSHEAWVKGEATSFLPGPAEHKLVLEPAPAIVRQARR